MDEKCILTKGNTEYTLTIEELKTEIAQCLQFENLNFLLGAGCSSYVTKESEAEDAKSVEKAIPTMATLSKKFYETNPDFKTAFEKKQASVFQITLKR